MTMNRQLVSGHRRALIASTLLGLNVLLGLFTVVMLYLQVDLVSRAKAGKLVTLAEVTANDNRLLAISQLSLILLIATGIAYLFWIYRAHDNLSAIGAGDLTYTPGWAVGGFLVPFLNYIRPYQVVKEIWKASDPQAPDGYAWRSSSVSPLVPAWWILWISSGLVGYYMLFTFNVRGATIDQLLAYSWTLVVAKILTAIDAVLAFMVVLQIDDRQIAKSKNPPVLGARPPIASVELLPVPSSKPVANVPVAAQPVESYYKRGTVSLNKRDYDRAILEFDLAIQLKPDYADAYFQRGLAYYYNHRYTRAIDDLSRCIDLKPQDASAFVWRSKLRIDIGECDTASVDLQKAEELGIAPDLMLEVKSLKEKLK